MHIDFEVEKSKDGYNIFKLKFDGKTHYMGSKYNQKRQIENFINSYDELSEKDIYIVFGLSCGEHIAELIQKSNSTNKILVIEINENAIDYVMENNLLQDKVKEKIIIAKNLDEVNEFLRKNISEFTVNYMKVGYYCEYSEIYKDNLNDIYKAIRDESYRYIAGTNTSIMFAETWFNTLMNNLRHMAKSTPVNKLKDKYLNKPAIIVSAGPSLTKNIEYLKGIDNALILTGGRTLKALMEIEVEPSCIGVVDPGELSYSLVEGYIDKTTAPLLFYDGTNSEVVNKHKGKKVFSTGTKLVTEIWGEFIQNFSMGGSVAHVLTLFAIYMGCSPIIFVGQDLAYTDEKEHSDIALDKRQYAENYEYKNENDIFVKDIYGNKIRTSIVLNSFRVALEEIIENFPEKEFINATEGGANIKGTRIETLKNVLNEISDEKVIEIESFLINDDKTKEVREKLEKTVKAFDEYLNLIEKLLKELNNFEEAYKSNDKKKLNKSIGKLDKYDEESRALLEKISVLESLAFNIVYNIENNSEYIIKVTDDEKTKVNKNLRKSRAINIGMKEMIEFCYDKVEATILELNVDNGDSCEK